MNFDKTAMGHGHPFVNLQDVFGKNEVSSKNLGLAFSTENQRKDYCLNEGDVLFIRSSVKPEGVGEAAVVSKNMLNTTYSGFIIRFRPNIEMDVNFNRFVYSTANSRKQILASSTSSANSNINQDSLQRIQLALPCKQEQTQIGNYFQKLDSLINQHQQKHDKLSNIKKAMLEKMFPEQGKTIPEIRFKGFSGEWEDKVLEDICDVRDGTHASPQYHRNGFPLVTSKNVKNGYINYDDVQYISKTDFDEINKRSKVDINDILMGMIGTIGNIALIREAPDFGIKNVALIKDKKIIDFLYIYFFLQSPITTQQLEDCASGGTQKFISLSNVRHLLTCLPEREEQTQIGKYFQKLDALINQHQQQITKLNNIKQACLRKMFV
jgi:type I restriction enzyme S subunit